MNNPYSAPNATLAQRFESNETYEPKIFSIHGRIGRVRYLMYPAFLGLCVAMPIALLNSIIMGLAAVSLGIVGIIVGFVLMGVFYIALLAMIFIIVKRRLNDLNHSGWLSLLFFVPLANFILAIYLLCARGTDGTKNYGPKPTKNPQWLKVLAIIWAVIIVVGSIVSIAMLPRYIEELERATAAIESTSTDAAKEVGSDE